MNALIQKFHRKTILAIAPIVENLLRIGGLLQDAVAVALKLKLYTKTEKLYPAKDSATIAEVTYLKQNSFQKLTA